MCLVISLWTSTVLANGVSIGRISAFHLNSGVNERGVCVQLSPAINSDNAWACLDKGLNQHLYKEMTTLLLTAYAGKNECTLVWDNGEVNHGEIIVVECR